MSGTAILVSSEAAQAWAQVYIPPVTGPYEWFNLGATGISNIRRLNNWGSEGGSLTLAGGAALASIGIQNTSTTVDSRCTMRSTTPASFTAVGIMDVAASAAVLRVADIRLVTTSTKQLKRIMTAGQATISTALPASGAVVYFVQGDSTGHRFGFITTANGIVSSTSTAVGDSTKAAYIGGSTETGQVAAAYSAYAGCVYPSVLVDADLLQISDRMYRYAAGFGVTVNG
ncbi:hypothetical protein [Klebsiella variicola]|uniref:hypothetical protein n=1 Tax=Klebsiella variicola TaxID=244366 RepID=UPI0011ED14C1|nr:hypothetical protein [Klebsiella variicola]KAA0473426.1 hypothetical protein F0331_06520 [Klebsiella variicola]